MKKRQLILALVVLAALVALWFWGRNRIHFDFGVFRAQIALADWRTIAIGLACIYFAYILRAVRWALLMKHAKRVPLLSLLGNYFIVFNSFDLM
ncbi:MAG: hypothetical protein ABSD67_22990 [Terracidiphilus sp.]